MAGQVRSYLNLTIMPGRFQSENGFQSSLLRTGDDPAAGESAPNRTKPTWRPGRFSNTAKNGTERRLSETKN
jgi:hypothetical protein